LTRPTLGQIAKRVEYRGTIANLYLEKGRYPLTRQPMANGVYMVGHEHDPLTLFDELSAYTNAATIAKSEYSPLLFGLEMCHYAATVVRYAPADYPDRIELARVWVWYAQRLTSLYARARRTGRCLNARQAGWASQVVRDYKRIAPIANARKAAAPKPKPAVRATQPPIRYRIPTQTAPDDP